MLRYVKNLIQLIISPKSAWEDISAEMASPEELTGSGLWPLVALASLGEVVRKVFYRPQTDWGAAIVLVLATAVSYVCTYYIFGRLLCVRSSAMAVSEPASDHKCLTMESYVLGLLALVQLLTRLLPPSMALIYLLPAGVSIVMWKAEAYLGIRKDMTLTFYLWGVVCLILPPYFIQGFFKLII